MTSDQKTPPPLGESSREAIENLPPLEASRDAESSGAVVSELVEALTNLYAVCTVVEDALGAGLPVEDREWDGPMLAAKRALLSRTTGGAA